jgi:HEAT repeat protein
MKEIDRETRLSFLEIAKVSSAFISTVLIALVSIFVTTQYNNKQLEIAQIKEISTLIPKLGSADENERKFSAIALGLYGKGAIPPLIAILDDDDQAVRMAAAKSIALIGDAAIPSLERTFLEKKNSPNQRAASLWTLALMKAQSGFTLARVSLSDPLENPWVRKDAAFALGSLKDSNSTELLLNVLNHSKDNDIILTKNIVFSLGQIAAPSTRGSLISLLSSPDESLRIETVMALSQFKGADVAARLSIVMENDSSEKVRQAAKDAIEWQKRSQ